MKRINPPYHRYRARFVCVSVSDASLCVLRSVFVPTISIIFITPISGLCFSHLLLLYRQTPPARWWRRRRRWWQWWLWICFDTDHRPPYHPPKWQTHRKANKKDGGVLFIMSGVFSSLFCPPSPCCKKPAAMRSGNNKEAKWGTAQNMLAASV